ncbi:hypothetical protein O6H91_13G087300 [Diphasiastrum complanatum]|nr:hypothetical protein O6H91_13G087300 [Diphasiastrum complanatum]
MLVALLILSTAAGSEAWTTPQTLVYNFTIQPMTLTRLCSTKSIVSVNSNFPGPTIYANEGDRIIVKVTNTAQYNITLHWHGVRQLLSCWSDGPAYITQCPVQTGQTYVYNYTFTNQSGTLFWHAHETWLRGTVYGAIVIFPQSYPYTTFYEEHVVLLGEWWKANVEDVETQALQTGNGPAKADAYTINGLPGPLYNCSGSQDTWVLKVLSNKTYLLRIVNAALNTELFFSIANHNLTVVEIDGDFTKHYTTNTLFLTPGQSTNALLTTDQPVRRYYMGASPYMSAANVSFQKIQTLAVMEYQGSSSATPITPSFPGSNDTNSVTQFSNGLKSLNDGGHPEGVPQTVDKSLFFTVGLGLKPCNPNQTCQGPNGKNFTASVSNVSFVLPKIAILQAYYFNLAGVYQSTLPDTPLNVFDYTGNPPNNLTPESATKLNVIPFNSNVQLVLQDTSLAGVENHPIHLHGYSFYIVGQGFGNFQASNANFNLVDPPRRNTVGVPVGGWAAIRFKADNPGVWYMHCHLEIHTTWGLAMAFIVQNGVGVNQTLPPPPSDLPMC